MSRTLPVTVCLLAAACGNPVDPAQFGGAPKASPSVEPEGPTIEPPFAVSGDLEGLLLVYFDAKGAHTARTRSEIPESSRATVRVESLHIAPDQGLAPEQVYVADLRSAGSDGSYPVRIATRQWFDAQADRARPVAQASTADAVILYKAAWCGACKSAAAFLRGKQVEFVEKDVEKDPSANAEMLKKASDKGLSPRGVPVIDYRGEILLGFDQARLSQLIERDAKTL